jgi:hypothetical protein
MKRCCNVEDGVNLIRKVGVSLLINPYCVLCAYYLLLNTYRLLLAAADYLSRMAYC